MPLAWMLQIDFFEAAAITVIGILLFVSICWWMFVWVEILAQRREDAEKLKGCLHPNGRIPGPGEPWTLPGSIYCPDCDSNVSMRDFHAARRFAESCLHPNADFCGASEPCAVVSSLWCSDCKSVVTPHDYFAAKRKRDVR